MSNPSSERRVVEALGKVTAVVSGGVSGLTAPSLWAGLAWLALSLIAITMLQALWLYWRQFHVH